MKTDQKKGESRKRMSELEKRIDDTVDRFCKENDYEITYAEILNVFFRILKTYSGELLKQEWEKGD